MVGGSYALLEQIGGGASGVVWRALDQSTGEEVAIKLLREELVPQPKAVMRFVQERAILAALQHENIVPVRELLTVGHSIGLVMELVPGGSVRDLLRERGPLPPAQAATIMAAVADALAHAHQLGVIHRDLKPDNILLGTPDALDWNPRVRLTDFGIARVVDAPALTTTGALLGTPNYLAPEIISGARATPAADVYAFGMVLFELLTGRPPYAGHTPRTVMRRHVETRPQRNPGIPDPLWKLISACVEKTPARRPDAATLGGALRMAARRLGAEPALRRLPVQSMFSAVSLLGDRPRIPTQRRRVPAWHAITTVVTGFVVLAVALVALEWPGPRGGHYADASRATPEPTPSRSAGPKASPSNKGGRAETGGLTTANKMQKSQGTPHSEARVEAPKTYGPMRCTGYKWNPMQPALSDTCYSTGPGVRMQGSLKSKEVTADITLTLEDTAGNRVGEPQTCRRRSFAKEGSEQTCGPFELTPPRGKRYVIVQSWLVYSSEGAIIGSAKSAEFAF